MARHGLKCTSTYSLLTENEVKDNSRELGHVWLHTQQTGYSRKKGLATRKNQLGQKKFSTLSWAQPEIEREVPGRPRASPAGAA